MTQVVIVLAVGRSGSTLMQRVLNTMPSTNICGENYNAWIHLARFAAQWMRLRCSSRAEYEAKERSGEHFWLAWYNVADQEVLITALRSLFLTLYQADRWRRVGFKEIRLGEQGYEVLQAQLDFFRMLFPDCKIIFNLRDSKAILRSQSRQRDPEAYGKPSTQALFERYACENDSLIWHYEDWDKPNKVKQLYAYLEEPFSNDYLRALKQKTS